MNKLNNLFDDMDEEELEILKRDLETGQIQKLINNKLQEKQIANMNKVCPVCHSKIKEDSLTIIFGPKGLRKKASFCALDCLEYFINKIKNDKTGGGD